MATYRFRVWPNSSAPYIVTGNGMSWIYARENVARREGVNIFDVMPVNGNAPIDDDSSSNSNKNNISNPIGTIILLGILLFFGAILTYWKIILICAIITGIIWWWYNK